MTDYGVAMAVQGAVKLGIVLAGTACVFLGYRLFVKGVFEGGGSIRATGWKATFAMNKGGPGLIFALFGAVIVLAGVSLDMSASVDRKSNVDAILAAAAASAQTNTESIKATLVVPSIDLRGERRPADEPAVAADRPYPRSKSEAIRASLTEPREVP
jgi:hypothetical protein